MIRLVASLVLVVMVVSAAGCRMCDDPYDYTGPVVKGSACDPTARSGSVLSIAPGPAGAGETHTLPQSALGAAPADPVVNDETPPVADEPGKLSVVESPQPSSPADEAVRVIAPPRRLPQ